MKALGTLLYMVLLILPSCDLNAQQANEPTISDAFVNLPVNLSHVASAAAANEPGSRMRIRGVVYESDGKTPAKNVLMYFYQTNAKGVYPKRGNEPRGSLAAWHGYLRGWVKTNAKGEYELNSIKPATYPARVEPAHVHVAVQAPSQKRAYEIGAITFRGDELADEEFWRKVIANGHPRDDGTLLVPGSNGDLEGIKNYTLYAKYDK